MIDNKLNFSNNTRYVNQNLNKIKGAIYSLSSIVPRSILLTLYNSLVLSTVNYNILIWGGAARTNADRIQITLNKILRIILNVKFNEHYVPSISTNDMFKSLGLLKFRDLYGLSLLKFLHFVFYNDNEIFDEIYQPLLPSHGYATRGIRINIPDKRLDVERRFVVFQSCKLLNELSDELIMPQSRRCLNRNFKRHILEGY